LSSCHVGSDGFHSLLKCLKRFIVLLPDAAVRIADDECGGVCIKLLGTLEGQLTYAAARSLP
jgi:hypothetical protein